MKQRSLVIIALLFIFAAKSSAQENNCALKLSQLKPAPEVFGFHLGMTVEEVKKLVPTLPTGKADELGVMKTSFSPRFDPKIEKDRFENVRTVSFEFFDNKVMDLWIGYTNEFKWATIEEFLPQMSASFGLSANGWKTKGIECLLECEEFLVEAKVLTAGPSIHFTDKVAKKLWEERRTKMAEEPDK
jgi:hypothetical protein